MLKQKFLIDFVSKFGIIFLTATTGIVVARLAGPSVVGTISYATAYVSMFSFVTGLFGSAHIKLVSEGQTEADCNQTYLYLFQGSLVVYAFIVLCCFMVQKFALGYDFDGDFTETVILTILLATVVLNFYQFAQTIFVARTEHSRSNMPLFVRAILYNLFRLIVVLFGYGALALAGTNLLSAILMLPLVIYFLKKIDYGKFDVRLFKKYWAISLPLLIFGISNSIITYSDKLILEFYSDKHEIGIYTAAASIGGMLILLGNTVGTIFFPLFSSLISRNAISELINKIYQFERFIFVFILPFIITLSIFSVPIMLTLLGPKYEQSGPIFGLLVFSSFFIIWGMPYGNVLTGMGLFWLAAILNILKAFLFIVTLMICLHPKLLNMGAKALAVTQLISNFFVFFVFYVISYYKIKVQFITFQLKYIIFGLIVYSFTVLLIVPLIDPYSIYIKTIIIMPIYGLMVFILQYVFGLLEKRDLHMLSELFNLKKIYNYIKSEL
ncbi:oligosaccharide flippase family protein [Desulfotignum phosphitoxidans]|uniref:Putative membrane protein, polysaccharide biosynthesis family n=1 Tax=Desulfotignum phosphitoxidans DSM 13687 TaxID=1286635 RepID=S0G0B9_9BACT|nr:oligosaccharide flippase family protein [Desulfotignum phosphitoxidans]EMS77657.1 putative membrane protein, polysaccharide biosynthesis family [Desulfotignum phosphitoxidans DSM 13687]